jgi:hypothetical protein
MNKKNIIIACATVSIASMAALFFRSIITIEVFRQAATQTGVASSGVSVAETISTTMRLMQYLPVVTIISTVIMLTLTLQCIREKSHPANK